jgi:hypothetical protein
MTATGASAGGADLTVSQAGSLITAEVFAGADSHVNEYISCIVNAGRAPGWFGSVVGQTSDADGLQAPTFGGGAWTILSWATWQRRNGGTFVRTSTICGWPGTWPR